MSIKVILEMWMRLEMIRMEHDVVFLCFRHTTSLTSDHMC